VHAGTDVHFAIRFSVWPFPIVRITRRDTSIEDKISTCDLLIQAPACDRTIMGNHLVALFPTAVEMSGPLGRGTVDIWSSWKLQHSLISEIGHSIERKNLAVANSPWYGIPSSCPTKCAGYATQTTCGCKWFGPTQSEPADYSRPGKGHTWQMIQCSHYCPNVFKLAELT